MGSRLDKKSAEVRKRIQSHAFSDENGDEYGASAFGGFGDYFRRKKIKLQNLDEELRASAADKKPQLFRGVVAHVSGFTQPPLRVLHAEIVEHGGCFLQYLDSKTMATHIIASAMPPKKTVDFNKYRIVKPAWVMDSIKAGRLLPWSDYRLLDDGPRQKVIGFDQGKMMSQSTQKSPAGYRDEIGNSFYAGQFQQSARRTASSSPTALEGQTPVTPSKRTPSRALPASPHGPIEPEKAETPSKRKAMTSEEHNAKIRQDPHISKSTTANPDFLKQYYSESRLHHLSTWRAELKAQMQRLAVAPARVMAKAVKCKPGSRRYIMHVDFDSFFCAVSLKKAPEYVDKPAAVAHSAGSASEIASCNYPARKFGVRNGMWMKKALELCPDIKVLPYDFPGYEDASRLFYECILEVGGVVQSVSIDEALLDVTSIVLAASGSDGQGIGDGGVGQEQATVDQMASDLRARIKTKTGCHVSVGIGANILLAKVALRKAKPAGQYQIKPEEVLDLLGELQVEHLPGVAYSIGGKLEEMGIKLVKDLRQTSKERLTCVLGPKTGERLWEFSRGIDRSEVGNQPVRKTVSAEVNWGIRFINQEEAEEFVRNLAKELERRLLNEGVRGKQLTVKIMRRSVDAPLDPPKHLGHGKCDTYNKSVVFGVATNNWEVMGKEAVAVLRSYKCSPGDLRGLGLQLSKLEPLKPSISAPDGSQKRISFGSCMAPPPARKRREEVDAIEDEAGSPKEKHVRASSEDPIQDDPSTPRKPKMHPAVALAKAYAADERATTPLNVSGTQFLLPPNPDPAVLAELPPDIRSKLMAQGRTRVASPGVAKVSRPQAVKDEIPPDIDREVFLALPEDVKAEVLAGYKRRPGHTLLPQSPKKEGILLPAKKTTPTKRGSRGGRGGRGGLRRARERRHDSEAGLLQTNFLTLGGRAVRGDEVGAGHHGPDESMEEPDPTFLAELPEDVRREVLADHRRRKLARKSGLDLKLAGPRRRDAAHQSAALTGGQAPPTFPTPPAQVAFNGLQSFSDIKAMLDTWHAETRDDGPHRADVDMLAKYLARVVLEERDMEKARKVVVWLGWLVEADHESGAKKGRMGWTKAVENVKVAVQEATRTRGLGSMHLG